ncbi:type I polyketide synthase [Actinoplanes siamensis]|uniref:Polyketide synthase n=1 Tax=Actinoplanes siamensis TaxID=1223317 RepID=A0A919ND91_9ACTN|nr:type I polyketide synthase [Actinoplanes siamensis]GIF08490.1 polyketide synthase [Actinoplanes siamensis]
MSERIAIVGMACRYPDAASPVEYWENILAGRRAFRRLPAERMSLDDYYSPDPSAPDRFYTRYAAVIEGYEFDRFAYKIAGSTFRSTDLTHWLALDVAATALADAGFPMAEGLPRERTGVIVGNTLTGEFSRANLMRLRWPYVRRVMATALAAQDWSAQRVAEFLAGVEASYKEPFPAIDEDTLAGGLANTIAGRICNYFDLKGGGYTVDGACSSSLLSVATACGQLGAGDLDVVVAGGVDLSIDPFEMIGFAKTGALARTEMRVYDAGSNGFWPGEGCGMVVLMRERDARAAGHRVYATVAGWGVSSDGKGGITRPEVDGYQVALRRAYERAGFGIETVGLFEGHGTGTKVGDATELAALSRARQAADPSAPPAPISSVKAMIGHTKAAAGVAGLIKAALAVHAQVLPPAVGCPDPHPLLTGDAPALRVLRRAEPWPADVALRAGVTAMGFGGINTHVVLEGTQPGRRRAFTGRTRRLAASAQDHELLLVDGASPEQLRERVSGLAGFVGTVAYAQLADLARTLQTELRDLPYRAAVVVSSPEDGEQRLRRLAEALDGGETTMIGADRRSFLGHVAGAVRIGYLFPGQGSGRGTTGGALRRRFVEVEERYEQSGLPTSGDLVATAVAQPRIVTGSMAGLRALDLLGLTATVAIGHSLGELSALHWAGAMDEDTLLAVAALRGRALADHSAPGTMAGISAGPELVDELLSDLDVVIAGYNGPAQTVIAGTAVDVETACRRATGAGVNWTRLAVSHAFHSPLVAPAAEVLRAGLRSRDFGVIGARVISTITGESLPADADIPGLLHRQITDPVLFSQAVSLAAKDVDLFIEVGPGQVLGNLATSITDVPSVSLDTDDETSAGLLRVAAAAYVTGAPGRYSALFDDRVNRRLEVGARFSFFASPCEAVPAVDLPDAVPARPAPDRSAAEPVTEPVAGPQPNTESGLELLRRLTAERAELPAEMVRDDSLLLDDLHLSSITVGQVVNQVTQQLGLAPALAPTNFATATLRELADFLEELSATAEDGDPAERSVVTGAAPWSRPFEIDLVPSPRPVAGPAEPDGEWQSYGAPGAPVAEELRQALSVAGVGPGVLVWLPEDCAEPDLGAVLAGARAALAGGAGTRFLLVQAGRGAAGMAKTLRLEAPGIRTTVVRRPAGPPAAGLVAEIVAEVAATSGFTETVYGPDGQRLVPLLRPMPIEPSRREAPLSATDVVLVTGGGKGITAECALALAADSGAALGLLGRADPASDAELAANLHRMNEAGLRVHYARADVGDAAQVRRAVSEVTAALGPVTAVLHGAGYNAPTALTGLDAESFRRALAPKVDGIAAVIEAVGADDLRLLVTFGSIIGRAGLRGEGHYATANEWLADYTAAFAAEHPACRTVCVEWSVWSGVGMGEKLSVVEGLRRDGVTPIGSDDGVRVLRRLIADPDVPPVVVVSSRADGLDTIRRAERELPLLRFLERPLVHYPDIELVTEVHLSVGSDRYLEDHRLDGDLLFPAVFGMEAMAQAGASLTGSPGAPTFERAEFLRPIVVPPDGSTTLRIAATVTGPGTVTAVIRSSETAYTTDHFRAQLTWADAGDLDGPPRPAAGDLPEVPLDPDTDLYGALLFQGGRFHRLRRYHRAAARDIDVTVAVTGQTRWFAPHLPDGLVLGDPGMRDTLMHGNQVCVPDATLLPVGVDRIVPAGQRPDGEVRVCATERSRDGDTYVYDIAVRDTDGTVVERWDGLRLRAVRRTDGRGPWAPVLLGTYLERSLADLIGTPVTVVVEPAGGDARRESTALAVSRAIGAGTEVRYRPDGRPEIDGGLTVSASHGAGVTVAVVSAAMVACDIEPVVERPEADADALAGPHASLAAQIARQNGDGAATAFTRVWTAVECLQKAGAPVDGPLSLQPGRSGAWTLLACGDLRIASLATALGPDGTPVVVSVLVDGSN